MNRVEVKGNKSDLLAKPVVYGLIYPWPCEKTGISESGLEIER
jgi:hypothetical protein